MNSIRSSRLFTIIVTEIADARSTEFRRFDVPHFRTMPHQHKRTPTFFCLRDSIYSAKVNLATSFSVERECGSNGRANNSSFEPREAVAARNDKFKKVKAIRDLIH